MLLIDVLADMIAAIGGVWLSLSAIFFLVMAVLAGRKSGQKSRVHEVKPPAEAPPKAQPSRRGKRPSGSSRPVLDEAA